MLVAVPEFRPAYEEHVALYEELLPHLLMGDLRNFLIDEYRACVAEAEKKRRAVIVGQLRRRSVRGDQHADVLCRGLDFLERVILTPRLMDDLNEVDRFWADRESGQFSPLIGYVYRHDPSFRRVYQPWPR